MSRSPPRNLLVPFERDRVRDFASGTGYELRLAKILQVLLTEGDTPQGSGEMPWRTAFGSGLHLLRHRNADAVLAELARVRARDALRRWIPSTSLRVEAWAEENALVVRARTGDQTFEARVAR
ncbi:MAG TPA: hypothetical protein DEF51_48290 [Myxococcales bacterium]|nr:hypothetical protein [Myxococcales bacterium]